MKYGLICGGALLLVLVLLVPSALQIRGLHERSQRLESELQAQEVMFPLYREMITAADGIRLPEGLEEQGEERLSHGDIASIPPRMALMASSCGVKMLSAVPFMEAMGEERDREFLPVNALVRGDLAGLRRFLLELGKLSYVVHVEELELRAILDTKEMVVKFWLALEEEGPAGRRTSGPPAPGGEGAN